jgi:hypothetical protein
MYEAVFGEAFLIESGGEGSPGKAGFVFDKVSESSDRLSGGFAVAPEQGP